MPPYLEVLTRTFGSRPKQLARCRASLEILSSDDWVQRVIVDEKARGVSWANRNLSTIKAKGDWVWVLDDDDLCCYADLLADLGEIVAAERPDAVMVRVYHGKFGMLPPYERWGERPIMGQVGGSCVISRRDIWNRYRNGWTETYAGDFWYINGLWDAGLKIVWLPVTAAFQPLQNNGAPEGRDHAS